MIIRTKWICGSLIGPFCNSYPKSKHLSDPQTHPKISKYTLYDTWLDPSMTKELNNILGHVIWYYGPFIIQKTQYVVQFGAFSCELGCAFWG